MPGAARDRLRAATADIHEALHGATPFARIAAGTMDRDGYAALLMVLHRYHGAMAASCAAGALRLAAPELASAHRARLAALEDDMGFFALPTPSVDMDGVEDGDFAVGCLYTVQGSTLGGKVIYRQLAALLPDGRGRGFFAGHEADNANWRLFCERLETLAPGLDFTRVEAGADHAFRRFADLLEVAV